MIVCGVLPRATLALIFLTVSCATAQNSPTDDPDAAPRPDARVIPPVDARVPDAAPLFDSGPTGPGFFEDDEAADFAGIDLQEARIAPWGGVEPVAYYTGGLLASAADSETIASGAGAAWLDVENMSFTGVSALARGVDRDHGPNVPTGLGLTGGDSFTLAFEGEIHLSLGAWNFHFLADDHGFVELAPPGTANYARVLSSDGSEASGVFEATTAGWYPIRIAHSEDTGNARMRLEATPPASSRGPIPRHQLRARVDHVAGLHMTAFDDSYLLGRHAGTIDAIAPVNADWSAGMPADLALTGADHFSVRWAGQLRIETEGTYAFRLVSDDGHRMWLDDTLVLDNWDETSHDSTTEPIALTAGWHDLMVDHMEITGSARANLTIASGPMGVGDPLSVTHLRPVVARHQRHDSGHLASAIGIPELGSIDAVVALDAPPGAKVEGLTIRWTFDHSYHGDLEIRLIAPDGSTALLRDNTGGSASGTVTELFQVTALDQASVRGDWTLRVTDTASLDGGSLQAFQITALHDAGEAPVPTLAIYDSEAKDLATDNVRYDDLDWRAHTPPGTSVQLRVRSADTEAGLSTTDWSTPLLDPGDGPPPAPGRRFFQYRIELISDGDGVPSVDRVRLDYTLGAT